jgi:hypothetical protein
VSIDTARGGERSRQTSPTPCLDFIERLNSVFTVLKNSKFPAFLPHRINCVEIVAPYGHAMVTVLRTPADQT